ncbi:saccharopine dehydrogenase [Aggregicoccus sp. 17bor-14]|uniref:saccharopine dehydrogenase family protein n=1 Tax=Myxococcaceae TaxID=31 RepID=UPI00129C1652|nr:MULTISPECIES: saccharopine dehydrogenase NADP-binding domain-containing protein [Myxococcaceae]MBF5045344.1 saccharopine dehydrogenase NADP-binding domain-containing protein [Simulacricoccus sp. 17bor-14]MRI91086.1 saccharopine dehydrogenase [Aggregicoccus sp. 17bor-14]
MPLDPAPPAAPRWMLYGASGYTGVLLAEEAVRRGHRPVLAGRTREKLRPLAERLGLEVEAVSLEDAGGLRRALEGCALVLHAAGPFIRTSRPMLRACLDAGVHYLDITGELPVFENTFRHNAEALERAVTLISGVGFDVVPTDCLALHVAEQVPGARELELAFAGPEAPSAGTLKSMLEGVPGGGRVRRNGVLQAWPLGKGAHRVRFSDRTRTVLPIPWGDLETAWHTTGIPDITTSMAMPAPTALALRLTSPLVRRLFAVSTVKDATMRLVERRVQGPDADARARGRSFLWARARAADGRAAEAWLETLEGYALTARTGILAVEGVLAGAPHGAHTPARAFGKDFVLQVEGTRRIDV